MVVVQTKPVRAVVRRQPNLCEVWFDTLYNNGSIKRIFIGNLRENGFITDISMKFPGNAPDGTHLFNGYYLANGECRLDHEFKIGDSVTTVAVESDDKTFKVGDVAVITVAEKADKGIEHTLEIMSYEDYIKLTSRKDQKKKKNNLWYVLLIILLVAAVFLGFYMLK